MAQVYALDMDGMLLSFPNVFIDLVPCLQSAGNKVGILSARKESEKQGNLEVVEKLGIKPDFAIFKPDDLSMSDGIFKAVVCNELGIDVLFDDFESDDPTMLADFFSTNQKTVPFTSWAYKPE